MPRLFTGIEIPASVIPGLARLQAPLAGAKWVDPADYHLTLRFAGDIDNRTASEFADFLASIESHAFELRLNGLGVFGGAEPRMIWAGVEPNEPLMALARAHERAARNAGLEPDRRNFKPHVTLARLRYAEVDKVARYLERFGGYRSEPFTVTRFVLFSSKPNVGGGPYVIEEAYPLSGWGFDHVEA